MVQIWIYVISLTDYPKTKEIEANYRGITTRELLRLRHQLFQTMMMYWSEQAAGYTVVYIDKGIEQELNYRNVQLPVL